MKYYKFNELSFSLFPYDFQQLTYKKLLYNFYPGINEFIIIDKGEKKKIVTLKTEIGNLNFLKKDLTEISKEEYENLYNDCKWNKTLKLKKRIDIEDFPYAEVPFLYIDIIEKKLPLKVIKKEILDKKEYLYVYVTNNLYTEEEFLVKPEDLELFKNNKKNV